MNVNWKLRLQNKTTLLAILAGIVALVYQICGILGITISISESEVINSIGVFVNLLVLLGVVVDPTTDGIKDSDTAMEYVVPKCSPNFDEEKMVAIERANNLTDEEQEEEVK